MPLRRHILKSITLLGLGGASHISQAMVPSRKPPVARLGAYYLRAHLYTLVPRHVREDLDWMLRLGTTDVFVAVLEQDLFAAVENLAFIITEAKQRGMNVWAVPSRWAGLVAGAPKVPSLFTVTNPSTWALMPDGSPRKNNVTGVTSSVYDPAVLEFMVGKAVELLKLLPFKGIIWDEPKSYDHVDYHPESLKRLGPKPSWEAHVDAVSEFWSTVNERIKAQVPSAELALFIYAQAAPYWAKSAAAIRGLDYFGADGRPWGPGEGKHLEAKGKTLLDTMPTFQSLAKENGKKSLFLIENHNLATEDYALMQRRLPALVKLQPDFLLYYYYPRNLQDPDKAMEAVRVGVR